MTSRTGFARPFALCAASLAALSLSAPAMADDHTGDRAPMTAQDLVTMPRLGAPVVTPDGQYALYAVTVTDPETYERSREYYLRDLTDMDRAPVKVDLGKSVSAMQFGQDGFLYFVSSREGPSGGEANSRLWRAAWSGSGRISNTRVVADLGTDIEGFSLSPAGDAVAVWGEIARDCPRFGCEEPEAKSAGDGLLYEGDGGFIRHWDTWEEPGKLSRVFVIGVEDGKAVGDPVAVDGPFGEGPRGDTPTKPFGGGEDIAWAPDGSGVYFVSREADATEPTSTNLDIWWSDLSGGVPTNLTRANQAYDSTPTPSPNGQYLAYLAMERPGYEADRLTVMLRDLKSGVITPVTADFDRSFGSIAWTADSRYLIATAQDVLDTPAYRIDPQNGAVERLDLMAGNEAHIGNVMPLAGNRLLFTRDSIGAPSELFLSTNLEQAQPLTQVATQQMGMLTPVAVERFSFIGANGDTVWGQITKLQGHEGRMPAILYVHGGPQGSFNDGWSSRWNPRVVASQGYAVISVDFHGSTGYGQAFTDSINRDWGGKPLEDLQKGLDAALKLDPQIDGSRACAMGASYGGYMMNWIAGMWPDRFDCLVQHDGLFDMRSMYYSTEELWFPRWDFGGSYAENSALYEKWNPVNHVDKWKTPMLVVTGMRDFRVPYTQGIQSFTALQEREIPSQLLVFEDENHWVLGAANSLQWHETVFAWLDRWLKQPEAGE